MDTSVYIFEIILDIFIVFTIFAIYFYVLCRYFLHTVEEEGLIKFFKIHVNFYKPVIKLMKLFEISNNTYDKTISKLNTTINNINEKHIPLHFTTPTYTLIGTISFLSLILIIYFLLFYKKIIEQIHIYDVIITIVVNLFMILVFELMFIFLVYCNIDLFNIAYVFNI